MSETVNENDVLTKKDKFYLNSKSRMAKALIWGILEYILIAVIFIAVAAYIQYGNLNNFMDELKGMGDWLRPGGMLFNAIVGFLPIMILSNIGAYFGSGTKGKMLFGIIKCLAIIVWLVFIVNGASTSIETPTVVQDMGLEGVNINLDGLAKFAVIILLASILIPIGEYLGARKKHAEALRKKKRLEGSD